ncbi:hypothetical protein ACFL5O_06490 [Myxococcota bacterium]
MTARKMLEVAQGMRLIYDYGFELKEESFVELTFEQYQTLRQQGVDTTQRWFRVTRGRSENTDHFEGADDPAQGLAVVNETDRQRILEGMRLIYRMTSSDEVAFDSFRDRLEYLRQRLPAVVVGKR